MLLIPWRQWRGYGQGPDVEPHTGRKLVAAPAWPGVLSTARSRPGSTVDSSGTRGGDGHCQQHVTQRSPLCVCWWIGFSCPAAWSLCYWLHEVAGARAEPALVHWGFVPPVPASACCRNDPKPLPGTAGLEPSTGLTPFLQWKQGTASVCEAISPEHCIDSSCPVSKCYMYSFTSKDYASLSALYWACCRPSFLGKKIVLSSTQFSYSYLTFRFLIAAWK